MKSTRRAFLAGSAAVAIPGIAVSSPVVITTDIEQSPLVKIIAEFEKADKEAAGASAVEMNMLDLPDRPDWAHVKAKEFSARHFPLKRSELYHRQSINQIFDEEDYRINAWLDLFSVDGEGNPTTPSARNVAIRDERLERNAIERGKLLKLYADREAVFDRWSETSGYAAAKKVALELEDVRCDFEDQILNYPVSTFDDVKLKADFIDRSFGGETLAFLTRKLVAEISALSRQAHERLA